MKNVISVDTTGGDSSYKELVEKLATIEHERWSDWQKWCHKVLREHVDELGLEKVLERWEIQIATPYAELSEPEKQSDREQVQRYLPLLHSLLISKLPEKKYLLHLTGNEFREAHGFNKCLEEMRKSIDEMFEVNNESK